MSIDNLFPEEEVNGMSEMLFVVKQRDALKSLIDTFFKDNFSQQHIINVGRLRDDSNKIMSGNFELDQDKLSHWINTRG